MEYGEAWGIQKQLFNAISQNEIIDTLIILQHPPVYTFGRRTIGRQLLSNKT
ncbi:MAG TPA: lipoyl(octanoyl) transferase, partial [Nitrospiraceae bacterium]|nr:lipoyl(octanoyl) transferase [Nitrospiraceae bacterium]